MFYAVSVMMLGYTRINGVVAYNNSTREFLELTPAKARELINTGKLKGLKWINTEDGVEFVCDTEGWNQQNMPIKTACGKFRPMLNDYPGVEFNSMFTLVRVVDVDECRLYEVVSNKCCRIKMKETDLRGLANITNIAGCWIKEDEIVVADGVLMVNRRTSAKEEAVEVNIAASPLVEEPVEAEPVAEEKSDMSKDEPEDSGKLDMNKVFSVENAEETTSDAGKKPTKKSKRK